MAGTWFPLIILSSNSRTNRRKVFVDATLHIFNKNNGSASLLIMTGEGRYCWFGLLKWMFQDVPRCNFILWESTCIINQKCEHLCWSCIYLPLTGSKIIFLFFLFCDFQYNTIYYVIMWEANVLLLCSLLCMSCLGNLDLWFH